MNAKKRCFICKEYAENDILLKTNYGYAHKTCLFKSNSLRVKKKASKTSKVSPKAKKRLKTENMSVPQRRDFKELKKDCDELWSECIKARAKYKSEISGKEGRQIGGDSILNAHHISGKSSLRLRYELENGICLTKGEHFFGIHHQGRQKSYEEKIKKVKGKDIYEKMKRLKNITGKTDLNIVEIYLKKKLSEYKLKVKKLRKTKDI